MGTGASAVMKKLVTEQVYVVSLSGNHIISQCDLHNMKTIVVTQGGMLLDKTLLLNHSKWMRWKIVSRHVQRPSHSGNTIFSGI